MAPALDLVKNPILRKTREDKDLIRRKMNCKSNVISQRRLYSRGHASFVRSMDIRELIVSNSRIGLRKR